VQPDAVFRVADRPNPPVDYAHRHAKLGWWSLLIFSGLGLVLETLHGFKIGAYLDVSNETRRLMWTLAHVHGTLLAVLHILFGLTVRASADAGARNDRLISMLLTGASVLLPVGFFLGGFGFYAGDPGLGVLLVPIGAVLLLAALYFVASSTGSTSAPVQPPAAGRARQRVEPR
jgi:hypothetical protein